MVKLLKAFEGKRMKGTPETKQLTWGSKTMGIGVLQVHRSHQNPKFSKTNPEPQTQSLSWRKMPQLLFHSSSFLHSSSSPMVWPVPPFKYPPSFQTKAPTFHLPNLISTTPKWPNSLSEQKALTFSTHSPHLSSQHQNAVVCWASLRNPAWKSESFAALRRRRASRESMGSPAMRWYTGPGRVRILKASRVRKVGLWGLIWTGLPGRTYLRDISSLAQLHWPLLYVTWIRYINGFGYK